MGAPGVDISPGPGHRRGQMALALQEVLTATVRLRERRQVASDATSFREHMKTLFSRADGEMRALGYTGEDARLAVFAVIAFLDESVLNSQLPMFQDWPLRPLQEEVFGEHMAGEVFFQYLRQLLGRQDAEDAADLLEVYQLCLLLGFKGRYTGHDQGELRGFVSAVSDKIRRVRGGNGALSPRWQLPGSEQVTVKADPWLRRIVVFGVAILGFWFFQLLVFRLLLRGGITDLREIAARLMS